MAQVNPPDELFDFPCDYQFKAFGEGASREEFCRDVLDAVSRVIPVSGDALQLRSSAGGRYICVTVTVYIEARTQLEAIYTNLKGLEGLCYLL